MNILPAWYRKSIDKKKEFIQEQLQIDIVEYREEKVVKKDIDENGRGIVVIQL